MNYLIKVVTKETAANMLIKLVKIPQKTLVEQPGKDHFLAVGV